MRMLLRVALDLSTSTKPFDSVTAAHLINHMVHLEGMQEALAHWAQEQGLSTPPPSADGPQASAASVLERNTLAGVIFVALTGHMEFSFRAVFWCMCTLSVQPVYTFLCAHEVTWMPTDEVK